MEGEKYFYYREGRLTMIAEIGVLTECGSNRTADASSRRLLSARGRGRIQ